MAPLRWVTLSSVLLVLYTFQLTDGQSLYEYNVACPPPQRSSYASDNGCTLVLFGGRASANITINTVSQLWFKQLHVDERYEFPLDQAYIVSLGEEEKRVRIRSSAEISVVVQKLDLQTTSDRYVGATEVYESRFAGYEFYPVSRPSSCTSTSYTNAYYTIVPTESYTRVAVYQEDVYVDAMVLSEYTTYTNRTTAATFDYSTFLIVADAPVTVFSGCACVQHAVEGTFVSTLPPVELYGTQYFAPPIRSSVVSESTIRILASEDLTIIITDAINEVLNRGGILDTVVSSNEALSISCSKPCSVTQSTLSISSSTAFGNFQFNIVGRGRLYTSAAFTTLQYTSNNYISITAHGEPPYAGMTLDGESLDWLAWSTKGAYGYCTMAVTQGGHIIESREFAFAVYVYGHTGYYGGGYGFEVRLQGDYAPQPTPEPTVPTTPDGVVTYEYTAVCVPTHHQTNTAYTDCTLSIATDDDLAQVTMTNLDTEWEFQVRQGTPFVMSMEQAYQLASGVEEKRLRIISDKALFVTTTKEDGQYGDRFLDTAVWPEKSSAGTEFYILQGDATRNGCTSSTYRKAFFAIAAYEAATFVEVYDVDEFVMAEVLGTYSTYSTYTTSASTDWTSLRVIASKPIAVISGTLCNTDSSSGTYLATLPSINKFGQEFVVPSIDGPAVTARCTVRILASEDATVVAKDGVNYPVNKGETVMIDYDTIIGTSVITCSKPCLAAFFQRSTADSIGHFMTSLLPTDQFYSYRSFTTGDLDMTHYITVIVDGLPPMDDVLLDGGSLGDLVWGSRGGYSVTRVQVTKGQHDVISSSERKLAVYVYGHTLSYGGGYGYVV